MGLVLFFIFLSPCNFILQLQLTSLRGLFCYFSAGCNQAYEFLCIVFVNFVSKLAVYSICNIHVTQGSRLVPLKLSDVNFCFQMCIGVFWCVCMFYVGGPGHLYFVQCMRIMKSKNLDFVLLLYVLCYTNQNTVLWGVFKPKKLSEQSPICSIYL